MTQTEAALVIVMFCMIALVLLKDTGHLAGNEPAESEERAQQYLQEHP